MFYLAKIENGRMNVPEPEYLEAKKEVIAYGEALMLTDGKLTKCTSGAPKYIAMGDIKQKDLDGLAADKYVTIPVCRVESNQVYDVPVSAVPTALKVGDKVTLDSDALGVTATTTNGVVTIVSLNGATKAGDIITVRI